MKKLMTMLAAVATAFGLFAADEGFISGAAFDSFDADATAPANITWTSPSGLKAAYWGAEIGDKATLNTEAGKQCTIAEASRPARFLKTDEPLREKDGFLEINSGTTLISQKIKTAGTQTIGDDGLYFDGLVQFTSFEDAPEIADNAKIAVFPMVDDPDAETPTNSLWIAAAGNATNRWKTTATIDDGWHRVTIKMINNILLKSGSKVGFVVYIDGNPIGTMDAEMDDANLTSEAKYYNNQKGQLFCSLGDSAEMTEVAFGGKGAIDEIAFTETAPTFAASPKFAYLTGASNIDSFDFAGTTWKYGDDALEVMLEGTDSDTVEVENITAAEGHFVEKTSDIVEVTAGETSYVGEAKELGATLVIGGETKYFENAAAALAHIKDTTYPAETTATLTLSDDSAAIELNNENVALTLDLAGNTITQGENDAAAIVVENGALKIIDSESDGEVNGNDAAQEKTAISAYVAIEIAGGTFNGIVGAFDGLTISSCDPKISVVDNQDGFPDAQFIDEADGKTFVMDGTETYWIVDTPPAPKYAITVAEEITGGTVNVDKTEAEEGETVTVTATPADDYTLVEITTNGAAIVDNTFEMPAEAVEVSATFAEKPYVAQVGDDKFLTVEEALGKVWQLEQAKDFPITVTCLADTLTVPYNEQTVTLAKNETIEITADSWKFDAFAGNVVLAPGKTIKAKSLADGAEITTIPGYKVVKSAEAEGGYYTWSVEELPDVAQIGAQKFKSFADAWAAANVAGATNTIELLADDTVKAALSLDKAGTAITVNFNEKTLTFDITSKYAFQIKQNNAGASLTLNGGTLAAAAAKDGSNFNQFIQCYQDVTLDDMTLDVANMDNSSEYSFGAAVNTIMVMNGTLTISGTTKVINVPADNGTTNLVLSIGCHAGNKGVHKSRKVVFDLDDGVTFNNAGNVRLCGGTLEGSRDLFAVGTKFYYGATYRSDGNNLTVYADDDLVGFDFAARAGKPLVLPTSGDYYQIYGQLYTDLATAVAAMGADEEVFVYGDQTAAAATFTAAGKFIVGANKVTVTDLTLAGTKIELAKGGEFTNAAVTESDFVAPAEGQKLVNNAGTWTVKDIEYATLKVVAGDEFVSEIVVTNAAGMTVNDGDTFDIDNAVVVAYQSATFVTDYELDESKGTLVVTLDKAGDATIKVFSKASAKPIDPVDPEDPQPCKDEDEADAKVNAYNKASAAEKAEMINTPAGSELTGAAKEAYAARFEAVKSGDSASGFTVALQLIAEEKTALDAQAANDTKAIPVSTIAAAESATEQQIDVTPGFFYSVIAAGSLEGMKVTSCQVATASGKLTVSLPHYANSGFYTIKASVKAQTSGTAFVEDK